MTAEYQEFWFTLVIIGGAVAGICTADICVALDRIARRVAGKESKDDQ